MSLLFLESFLFSFRYIGRTTELFHFAGVVPGTYILFKNLSNLLIQFSLDNYIVH